MVRKYLKVEVAVALVLGLVAGLAIWSTVKPLVPHRPFYPFIATQVRIDIPVASYPASSSAPRVSSRTIRSVPVLSYHQMNNGGTDSVTQQQFYDQMNWLHSRGYHTITMPEYVQWAAGHQVMLPRKPVLLTVDDGIANFYEYATPVLRHFGYNAVSMIVSGFATRAQNYERKYWGWDATWTQLQNLPPATWSFAFHAGWQGHLLSKTGCVYFYPCQRPHESAAAYHARVTRDIQTGRETEKRMLGKRMDTQVWAVPFNDLAQAPSEPQSGSAPGRWLDSMATRAFRVVFVDGLTTRNNQHYRYEVHGGDSLNYFARQMQRSGVFLQHPANTAQAREGGWS